MTNAEHCKKYYYNNREKVIAQNRKYAKTRTIERKISHKRSWLKKAYGITIEQWDEMFIIQKGKCKICKTHQRQLPQTLHVDHNHLTGKVRGLLCTKCNTAISHFKEDIKVLKSAIKYLKKNK